MCLTFTFDSIINALSLLGGATQIVQMFIIPVCFYIQKSEISIYKKVLAFLLMIILVLIGIYNLVLFIFDFIIDILYLTII